MHLHACTHALHTQNPPKLLLLQMTHNKNGLWPVTGKTGSLCSLGLQISWKSSPYQAHFNSGWIYSALIIVNVILIQSISKVGLNYFLCLQLNVCVWMVFQLLQACQSAALLKHKAGLKQTSHPYQSTRLLEWFCRHSTPQTQTSHPYQSTCLLEWSCWHGTPQTQSEPETDQPPVPVYMSVGMVLLTRHSSNPNINTAYEPDQPPVSVYVSAEMVLHAWQPMVLKCKPCV